MQGIRWIYNEYGAPENRITHIPFTNSEAGYAGEFVKLSSGRFTKASSTDAPAGILIADVASGTNQSCGVIQIREGDVFEGPYTGTPNAGFIIGAGAVAIANDGLSVDSSTVSGGALVILDINTTKKTCRFKVKNRQLS
jgi:hypothetical protein